MSDENNENKEKPFVAMWDYQNSDEDFNRRIVLDVTPLMVSDLPEQAKKDIIAAMDDVVKHLTRNYNVVPRPGVQENKIRPNPTPPDTVEK